MIIYCAKGESGDSPRYNFFVNVKKFSRVIKKNAPQVEATARHPTTRPPLSCPYPRRAVRNVITEMSSRTHPGAF